MALSHEDGVIEVACNLLSPDKVPPLEVQAYLERLVEDGSHGNKEGGMSVLKGYTTGKTRDELVFMTLAADESGGGGGVRTMS